MGGAYSDIKHTPNVEKKEKKKNNFILSNALLSMSFPFRDISADRIEYL